MLEMRNAYKIFIGKPGRKRRLGKSRHRLEDNIEMDIRKITCDSVDWLHLAQDRVRCGYLVNTVRNIQVS
jgi:hypothetical protein